MPAPTAVAATRAAVRRQLTDLPAGGLVLAAVSGGPDSLALAAALAWVAGPRRLTAGAVTVDHGLQAGSAERAAGLRDLLLDLGLAPVQVRRAVPTGPGGPEAAARRARYRALGAAAARSGAAAVLLGHTRDDQAEGVLLGLVRGSGARSLAGMPARSGVYRRPFLQLPRAVTVAACAQAGLCPWDDPHNADPAYTRSRIRHRVLPVLTRELGADVPAALARTAELLRHDADALDRWVGAVDGPDALTVPRLAGLPRAVRTRVLRAAAVAAGARAGALTAGHLAELDRLVTDWRGQGPLFLPGGLSAERSDGRVVFHPAGRPPTRTGVRGSGR